MYHDRFGFTDRPFQLTPDPRFWYGSATHRKAMAYLGYGLAQGEGFIVVTGEIGAGKTTLVGHLMATIDRARLNAVQLVSTQVDGDDALRIVANAFGVSSEGASKAALLDRIERFLRDEAASGKRALLVVDEAQALGDGALEELRMLSNFTDGGRALLQIFLLAQPEFREKLAAPGLEQLRQRVIATHHLEPMGADEIEPYMLHRLARVGWAGNPAFAGDAWAAFHDRSGGIPRRLNALAARVLLAASLGDEDRIDAGLVGQVADEMAADGAAPPAAAAPPPPMGIEPELPLRRAAVTPIRDTEAELLRRVVSLESRLEEQDRAVRRVLELLVEWVEGDDARPTLAALRPNAA